MTFRRSGDTWSFGISYSVDRKTHLYEKTWYKLKKRRVRKDQKPLRKGLRKPLRMIRNPYILW